MTEHEIIVIGRMRGGSMAGNAGEAPAGHITSGTSSKFNP